MHAEANSQFCNKLRVTQKVNVRLMVMRSYNCHVHQLVDLLLVVEEGGMDLGHAIEVLEGDDVIVAMVIQPLKNCFTWHKLPLHMWLLGTLNHSAL